MGEGRLENLQKEVSSAIRRQRSWTDAAALLRTCATRRVLLKEFCLSALLGSYAKATKWRKSLDGLEASNDDLLVPDVFCYTAVLNALERGRCWSLLGSLFIRMSQEGIQRNLISVTSARVCWSSVLKAAHGGTPSTWTRLCALLTDMSSGSIAGDVISFNAAMHRTPWQLSGAVLRMMNLQRVFPDVATFTHAMNACALKLSWHEALLFAGAAWTAQVQLDQMALTPLLAAHPWRKGLSLAQARAQVGTHTWNDGGLQLDSVCWSALLAASHWQKALELGRCLPCASITLTTAGHNALLSASGHWARAWTLFERGDALRAEVDVFSYNSVVASQKRWQSALVILQEMSTSQVEGDRIGVNALISLSSDSSEWPRAFDAFRGLSSSSLQPDVVTFSARMEACAQALQWELGFDSLVAMMNVGVEANAMTRTSLCSALCSLRGAWTMALATWKRTADVDASYYNILMSSCGSHWRMVLHLLHQMPLVPPILAPDQKCWSTAARALSAGVVWRGALEILEMLGEHDGLDMVMQDVLLSTLDLSGHLRSYGEALQAMADGWREGNAHAVKGTPPGDRVWEEPSRGSPDSSCWSSGVMFPKCTEFSSARHGPTSWRGALAEMRSRQLEANLIRGRAEEFGGQVFKDFSHLLTDWDLEIDLICCGFFAWNSVGATKQYCAGTGKEVALWQLAGDLVRPLAEPDLLAATAVLGACVERWTQSLACLSRWDPVDTVLDEVADVWGDKPLYRPDEGIEACDLVRGCWRDRCKWSWTPSDVGVRWAVARLWVSGDLQVRATDPLEARRQRQRPPGAEPGRSCMALVANELSRELEAIRVKRKAAQEALSDLQAKRGQLSNEEVSQIGYLDDLCNTSSTDEERRATFAATRAGRVYKAAEYDAKALQEWKQRRRQSNGRRPKTVASRATDKLAKAAREEADRKEELMRLREAATANVAQLEKKRREDLKKAGRETCGRPQSCREAFALREAREARKVQAKRAQRAAVRKALRAAAQPRKQKRQPADCGRTPSTRTTQSTWPPSKRQAAKKKKQRHDARWVPSQ
ncbi:unnamed protein product [Durusdinium trenchii]|uniref:Pentatricopeptide repeat-containing protein, chloroplastic n=1 Tax=Durusdinium trenchii TaxID=1381693 RepID=A0ABP0N1U5_9DINO